MDFDIDSVTWQRAEYRAQRSIWKKIRDASNGEESIKDGGDLYLPRLGGHTRDVEGDALYKVYLDYAHWYSATGRTLAGLRGLVFRKDPLKSIPEELQVYEDNITADGQSLMSFTKDVLVEVLQTNRCGVFIDFPDVDIPEDITEKEMHDANIRPYVRMYRAENIINWRTTIVNNETVTSLVVLTETVEEEGDYGFDVKYIPQYRVLYLDELGVYHQRIYQMLDTKNVLNLPAGMNLIADIVPVVNGEVLYTIPFYTITDKGITWETSNPTLLGLVNTNISHYRNSANREQALLWTGNPTPVFSGYMGKPGEGVIRLGSTEAILLNNGGTAGFLEFTGHGINPIKELMLEKEEEMAVLGARIIAPEKRSAETAESAAIHRAGEQGVLADIANSISDGLTRVLRFFGAYHRIKDLKNIWVKLNTDYMPINMDADTLEALGKLLQAGIISWETFVYQMQQGEILPLGITAKEELKRITKDKQNFETPLESTVSPDVNTTTSGETSNEDVKDKDKEADKSEDSDDK